MSEESTIWIYCRISKPTQSIERQIRNGLRLYPHGKIVTEAYTGRKLLSRPKWNELLKKVKQGDTIVFDSVSRMSRNAEEGIATYLDLYNKGIHLVFIKEPHINTSVYRESLNRSIAFTGNEIADLYIDATNHLLEIIAKEQIKIAFDQAEKEVSDLSQRTSEGILTAKLNGKQIGQVKGKKLNVKKSIPSKKKILECSRDFFGSLSDKDCIKITQLNPKTYYKYKKELKLMLDNLDQDGDLFLLAKKELNSMEN